MTDLHARLQASVTINTLTPAEKARLAVTLIESILPSGEVPIIGLEMSYALPALRRAARLLEEKARPGEWK